MLTEIIEVGQKIKEPMKEPKMKQSKIFRESTVTGKKLGLKSTIWSRRKK